MASKRDKAPETLLEAVTYFSDPDVALEFVIALRWPEGVTCPDCESKEVSFLTTRRLWKCKGCKQQFSAKVGTIFEDSPIPLQKWLPALWLIANCKNGISSYELARAFGITQKSAWFMLHRIRLAMQSRSYKLLSGHVEVDETFIGGKARNMHKDKRERFKGFKGRSTVGKVAVMGLLQRTSPDQPSQVHTEIVENTRRWRLQSHIRGRVKHESEQNLSTIYSDALKSYNGLEGWYIHKVIDHAKAYAEGIVHTNGMENYWSLLKRAIKGTYVSIEPWHLFRYLDEQSFRFNTRKDSDLARFIETAKGIFGRRLTYNVLIGEGEPQTC